MKNFTYLLLLIFFLFNCCCEKSDDNPDLKENDYLLNGFFVGPDSQYFGYNVSDWISCVTKHNFDSPNYPSLGWKTCGPFKALYECFLLTHSSEVKQVYSQMINALFLYKKTNFPKDWITSKLWILGKRYTGGYIDIYSKKSVLLFRINFFGSADKVDIELKEEDNMVKLVITDKHNNREIHVAGKNLYSLLAKINSINDYSTYVSPLENKSRMEVVVNRNIVGNEEIRPFNKRTLDSYYFPLLEENALLISALINYVHILELSGENTSTICNYIDESIKELLSLYYVKEGDIVFFREPNNKYVFAYGGNAPFPYNKQLLFVGILSRWWYKTHDPRIYAVLSSWKKYFEQKIEYDNDGKVFWKYWDDPYGNVQWPESLDYGGIDVYNLMMMYNNSDIFSKSDIEFLLSGINKGLGIMGDNNEMLYCQRFFMNYTRKDLPSYYLSIYEINPEIANGFLINNWFDFIAYHFHILNTLKGY